MSPKLHKILKQREKSESKHKSIEFKVTKNGRSSELVFSHSPAAFPIMPAMLSFPITFDKNDMAAGVLSLWSDTGFFRKVFLDAAAQVL